MIGEVSGYASVFGLIDKHGDVINPGAFTNLAEFRERGVVCWMHDWTRPIGVPLEVREDGAGLWFRAALHDTPDGRMAKTIVDDRKAQGKALYGVSIGYIPQRSHVERATGARVLDAVTLLEISLVNLPANPAASITAVKYEPTDPVALRIAALLELSRFNGVRV